MTTKERELYLLKQEEFYTKCGEILTISHTYNTPYARKTRWNDRKPGNGRYEGFGTIRRFSESLIHVTSKYPGQKVFQSEQEVYDYLSTIL